jgi:DNA-binding transcriptional LysR family regulator
MDLRQLRYFVQIAESGSLSRASDVLRIAQPSLSLQVKHLEEELGVELLVRHARGVTPTDLGLEFIEHARNILRDVERAKESVRDHVTDPIGKVCIGLPTSACRGVSVPLLNAIAAQHPRVSLQIVEAMTGNLDEWIQLGRLDVALLYDHRACEHVAWTEMMVEDLRLIVKAGSPLAQEISICYRRLAEIPLAVPARPNVLRSILEHNAFRAGIELQTFECNSLPAIGQLVRDSGYATVMNHFAFLEEIYRGELIAVPIVDPTPSWRLSVVVSQRTVNSRASEAVARVLANVIGDLVQKQLWMARLTESKSAFKPVISHEGAL